MAEDTIIATRGSVEARVIFDDFTPSTFTGYYSDKTIIHVPIGTRYNFGEGEKIAHTTELKVTAPVNGYVLYESNVIGDDE